MYNRKRNRRVIRILERILIRISVTLSIVTIGVLYWGGKNIEALEKIEENSKIDKDYIYAEREPLEVCVKEYIDSLPIPEEGINEDINIK